MILAALPTALLLSAGAGAIREAARLAEEALRRAPREPASALEQARRALVLTAEFDPTDFVKAGRKGEVVEDAFLEARAGYRRHRSRLYEAVGECLSRQGEQRAAIRYLGRAVLLDPSPERVARLARSLLAEGRGRAVLDLLERHGGAELGPESLGLLEQAVDQAALPSAQAEIDRWRIKALRVGPVEYRDGPFRLPAGARLSTGMPARLEEGLALVYVAPASCQTCSQDLEAIERSAPPDVRVVVVPENPDEDQVVRQVLSLYGHRWPVLLGRGNASALGVGAPSVLVVGRGGWVGALVRAPQADTLRAVLSVLSRNDVGESVPRSTWNARPADRSPGPAPPGLLPEGLAPGEEEPPPGAFVAAVDAYRAGRPLEALRFFEALEAKGDGWLLPPEARFNRALCLAALGQRGTARRLLLRIGDSRFQDAVDRALESSGSAPQRGSRGSERRPSRREP